jgi:DNA-binding beta-propeller fold protein YncE
MERVGDRDSAQDGHAPRTARWRVRTRSAPRRARFRLALIALLALAALAASAAPAVALSQHGHTFGFSFGSKGEALGSLSGPAGVAVNESTGDVYVVDTANQRLEQFGPEGESMAVWGFGVTDGDPTKFEVCTSGCKPGIAGLGESEGASQFDYPTRKPILASERAAIAIAIDNSTDPADESKGDVYVVSREGIKEHRDVVQKFTEAGEPKGTLTLANELVGGIGVTAAGEVWVQDGGAPFELNEFERFDDGEPNKPLSTVPLVTGEASSELVVTCPSAGFALDAEGKTLYVGHEPLSPFLELCPDEEQEEIEEEKKAGITVTRKVFREELVAKLRVAGEPLGAEPTPRLAMDREDSSAVAVDQSSGNQASGDAYIDNRTSVAAFDSAGALVQRFGEKQLTVGAGIGINAASSTGRIYVADYAKSRIDVFEFDGPGAPSVDDVSFQDIEPTATELKARVDPHGLATQVVFEYGTSDCAKAACTKVEPELPPTGATFGDVEKSTVVSKLQPATTYFFRVVATNSCKPPKTCTAEDSGTAHTFTTLPTAAGLLPDGRAWELVSPPDKGGAQIEGIGGYGGAPGEGLIQASEDGTAVAYSAAGPVEAKPEGNRAPETQEILSARNSESWSFKDVALPTFKGEGLFIGQPQQYQFLSSDLSAALVIPYGRGVAQGGGPLQEPPLVHELEGKEVTEEQRGIYRRTNFETACETPPKSCFEPLVTAKNNISTTPWGGELRILGATPDARHVVFRLGARTSAILLPGAKEHGIYEWNAGLPAAEQLKIVDVLPNNEVAESAPDLGLGAEVENQTTNARNAISANGTRMFWTKTAALYMRDTTAGQTINVSEPEAAVAAADVEHAFSQNAKFQFADKEGTRVFFTDPEPLTALAMLKDEATGSQNTPSADLYACDVVEDVEEAGKLKCRLKDLTVDSSTNLGEDADVAGVLPGGSEDGSTVYFVANGVLAPGALPGGCESPHIEHPLPGATCNLYVEHFKAPEKEGEPGEWEAPKLIAVLSQEDSPAWGGGDQHDFQHLTSRVSPSGRFLAFMSDRELTGYNNEDVNSKAKDEEVFLYDASKETVTCVSCNPTGERPTGVFDETRAGEGNGLLVDRFEAWSERWLAGSLPAWTALSNQFSLYQSRYLDDEGRLYFNSPDELVTLPEGEKFVHKENVYEFEPENVGSCTDPSGCVGLLTSGTSNRESAFLDASVTGSSVFVLTEGQLVSSDRDHSYDVYDVRECGGSPCLKGPGAAPRPCESTESCRGEFNPPPTFETPPSSSFFGSGNVPKVIDRTAKPAKPHPPTRAQLLAKALKECRKHHKKGKKRVACERRARRHFGAKKASHRRAMGKR